MMQCKNFKIGDRVLYVSIISNRILGSGPIVAIREEDGQRLFEIETKSGHNLTCSIEELEHEFENAHPGHRLDETPGNVGVCVDCKRSINSLTITCQAWGGIRNRNRRTNGHSRA